MKTKFLPLFFLLIIGFSTSSFTQENSDASKKDSVPQKKDSIAKKKDSLALIPVKPNESYLRSFWLDSKGVATAPFHWNTGEWIAASSIVAVGIVLYTQDKPILAFTQQNQKLSKSPYIKNIFDPLGNGLYSLPSLAILYGCGAIWKNDKAKETSLKGLEAFIITGATVQILKELCQRHRPYTDNPPNPYLWNGPYNLLPGAALTSFPSGHSAGAFAVATVISYSYHNIIWIPIVCYTLASLTAIARVVEDNHWATDAFVGSAIGFAIGSLVYHGSYRRLQILPVTSSVQGVSLIYHL